MGLRSISHTIFAVALAATVLEIVAFLAPVSAAAAPASTLITRLEGSQPFPGGTGFAWGESGNSFVVARTADNGVTWGKVGLEGVAIDLASLSPRNASGFPSSVYAHFLDPTHGWIVWSTNSSMLQIASTANGGTNWRVAASVPTDAVLTDELFPGPGRACLLAQMPEGMMRTTMVIMATDDSGATWTSSSTFEGDGLVGWTFRDATNGFVSANAPAGGGIFFYGTTDGGRTWNQVDLPLPPNMTIDDLSSATPGTPVFSGPQKLDGELSVSFGVGTGGGTASYRTTDGGKTWSLTKWDPQ